MEQFRVSQDVPIGKAQVSLAQLNERSREIFRQIVESYLATGEPVGSRLPDPHPQAWPTWAPARPATPAAATTSAK